MLKFIAIKFFYLLGWKLQGDIPAHISRCVVIVAPHTSNLDYLFGIVTAFKVKLPVRYLIKEEWLKRPVIGKLLKSWGALGITRSQRKNMVNTMADLLVQNERIILAFPPEGTRKLVKKWKTGFYYVALKARVPIVMCSLDYGTKTVKIGEYFLPTGDYVKDMNIVREFYRDITARYPDKFSLAIHEAVPAVGVPK
ncbi:MAG: 1-acyl-sn-glycerol-3-phosphate acyltransferase [Bacillota bacterium]|nr:1-acyl-sn-glycerol-3-phosphate acyltransferase [Bacillota bacterium]MDW7684548.1 1-acyl-sn-glycerol-3-phosphate acyltransferase [Bacillota bacterium]